MASFINKNYERVGENSVFYEINQRVTRFLEKHHNDEIISLGVGDVTRPYSKALVKILTDAIKRQEKSATFLGYPPEDGYLFLRSAIKNYYKNFNVNFHESEIFVSNGISCDIANILDIFDNYTPLIIEPTYPAYKTTNLFLGKKPFIICATEQNDYKVLPNNIPQKQYLIYLCSPNNPTGFTYALRDLKLWVDFALKTKSVILFDSAYEFFIEGDYPHSIFEVPNAKNCAIEFASFSKMAGFTNLRCGYTIIPKSLKRDGVFLLNCFLKRQTTCFNGVPYFVQKGAEYVLSKNGITEQKQNTRYYKQNVKIIAQYMKKLNFEYIFSKNSPYLWLKCQNGKTSWEFFDELLLCCKVVCVPGIAFGDCGEGYVRLSGFNSHAKTLKACQRIFDYYNEKSTTKS